MCTHSEDQSTKRTTTKRPCCRNKLLLIAFRKSQILAYVYILWMNSTCRQSRETPPFYLTSYSVLTSWKTLVTGLQVQRLNIFDCCHGPEDIYTIWCNISYRPFLPLSLSLPHHSFSPFFPSPQWNLIRLDCPLVTSPSVHVVLYPLPNPLLLPQYRFLQSGSGLIDVQQPYITVQPSLSSWWLQSCRTTRSIRVTPAVHTDHCLRNWKHIYKLQNNLHLKRYTLDKYKWLFMYNYTNYLIIMT